MQVPMKFIVLFFDKEPTFREIWETLIKNTIFNLQKKDVSIFSN